MSEDGFRELFKKIVYKKGLISKAKDKIRQFSRWDNDGSHSKHIINAIEEKDAQLLVLKCLMNGKTYEEWQVASKKISTLNSRIKRAEESIKRAKAEKKSILSTFGRDQNES